MKEIKTKKCPLIDNNAFQYFNMPVTGGNAVPESIDEVSNSYIRMVDHQMSCSINMIMTAKTNVLHFCNAGKDRTGVVSAILLHGLGMDPEFIIHDYMESRVNLKEKIDTYAKQFPNIDKEIIIPHRRYMEEFLDWLYMEK